MVLVGAEKKNFNCFLNSIQQVCMTGVDFRKMSRNPHEHVLLSVILHFF